MGSMENWLTTLEPTVAAVEAVEPAEADQDRDGPFR